MLDTNESFEEKLASSIEKVLLGVDSKAYFMVSDILDAHNMTFADCHTRPDVLNFALRHLYGDSYVVLVEKIRKELDDFYDKKKVDYFIEVIS